MKRRKFLSIAAGSIVVAGTTCYLLSDKSNFVRDDIEPHEPTKAPLKLDETAILYLASLAPSGHNTQPWFIKYLEPYHWVIGNDKSKWLQAIDPTQRETMLSIGAFVQNLEYAANNLGYNCQFNLLATTNQDENVIDVKLMPTSNAPKYDIEQIKHRRTVRSNYLNQAIKNEDLDFLMNDDTNFLHFLHNTSKEYTLINEQTIEANRLQSYRDPAQSELADWIRFSSKDAQEHADGLTMASMELNGIPAWVLRNFYNKEKVMAKSFREQAIDKVAQQVAQSGGWLLITSKDGSVETLIETGKRMQRLFLKVRGRDIAIHPMTQILEETTTNTTINQSIGISDAVQFILRVGYLKNYPEPVSLRRPVNEFVRM